MIKQTCEMTSFSGQPGSLASERLNQSGF